MQLIFHRFILTQVDQHPHRNLRHFIQGLVNRGQATITVNGFLYVIEANDGKFSRYLQSGLVNSFDRANG